MHIPQGDTLQLELVTFQQALAAAQTPSQDYDIEKWLYAPNFYSEYRYILGTRGQRPLICIGINPSTARPDALDNTLKSVERIALGNGFDSFLMFNVYAQRATRPDDMERVLNPRLHQENMEAFRYVPFAGKCGMGGVGRDHREAELSQWLRSGYGGGRTVLRRAVALCRPGQQEGAPTSPAVSA